MMDDDDDREHFNLKSIMKNEKSRKKRKQKTEENMKDNFEINVNDSRFSALYSSHLFAVDPSDPQFKYVDDHLSNNMLVACAYITTARLPLITSSLPLFVAEKQKQWTQ